MTQLKIILPLVFLCTSCSILPEPGEPPARFILEKVYLPTTDKSSPHHVLHHKKQLAVELPAVYAPLNTQRIAVMLSQNQIDYYAGIEWADRLPVLIQESIIQSLQDTNHFSTITRTASGLLPDYVLKIDVREFYINKTQKSNGPVGMATIEYFTSMINPQTHRTISNRLFQKSIPLPNEKKETIALILDRANQMILLDIIRWIEELSRLKNKDDQ